MGRWVTSLGVVSLLACADGGSVDSPDSYGGDVVSGETVCTEGEQMPCTADPNGPQYLCVGGQWVDTMCTATPTGGNGG